MIYDVKNIFLPLNGDTPLDIVMPTALAVARKFKARLSTVLLDSTSEQLIAFAGEGLATGTINEMMDEALNHAELRLKNVYLQLDSLQKEGKHRWYPITPKTKETLIIPKPQEEEIPQTSFEILDNSTHNAIIFRSRLSDMSIVPPLRDNHDPQASEILHNILFDSGRPLLIVPPTSQEKIGDRIAIAWNGSSEAAIALRCAMPWLKTAKRITLLHTPHYHSIGPDVSLAADYLSLHNITVEIKEFSAEKRTIGEELLKAADDIQADMLVMGAYSHSRLRQLILGGVTRHILENAHLPILMSR